MKSSDIYEVESRFSEALDSHFQKTPRIDKTYAGITYLEHLTQVLLTECFYEICPVPTDLRPISNNVLVGSDMQVDVIWVPAAQTTLRERELEKALSEAIEELEGWWRDQGDYGTGHYAEWIPKLKKALGE